MQARQLGAAAALLAAGVSERGVAGGGAGGSGVFKAEEGRWVGQGGAGRMCGMCVNACHVIMCGLCACAPTCPTTHIRYTL